MSSFSSKSHSSDSQSPLAHAPDSSWQVSTKRAHPRLPATTTNNWELDAWRQKRRRRDSSLSSPDALEKCPPSCSRPCQYGNGHNLNPEPRLASTSAQFNMFPKSGHTSNETRRTHLSEPRGQQARQHGSLTDLTRLRSTAFWELRQSITENGEGLVRRMRDYERSRSRRQVHQKAKEAEKRGRKRLPLRPKHKPSRSENASDASDEDVLICSGESSNHILRASFLGHRARSLDAMDVDVLHVDHPSTQHPRRQSAYSSPHTQYTSGITHCESDEEDAGRHAPAADPMTDSAPSLSHSTCESASSSMISLPLCSSSLPTTAERESAFSLPATASEKALAALNLALANGAGSISDYSSIWKYQERFKAESYDNGYLWQ